MTEREQAIYDEFSSLIRGKHYSPREVLKAVGEVLKDIGSGESYTNTTELGDTVIALAECHWRE